VALTLGIGPACSALLVATPLPKVIMVYESCGVVLIGLAVAGGLCLVRFCVCRCSVSVESRRSCGSLPFVVATLSCCALLRSLWKYMNHVMMVSCSMNLSEDIVCFWEI
jgi:hypothetical protein